MRKSLITIFITVSLLSPFVARAAETRSVDDLRAELQLLINQLVEMVARLQAQLVAMQEAENQPNQPSVGVPTEPTPESSENTTQDAPVVDSQMPSFTIELLETVKLSGGSIVWVPKKDGKVWLHYSNPFHPNYEGKWLKLFERAEILLNNELVRTYINTPNRPDPWAREKYSFWFPGTTEELKDSLILRVTIDGETLSVKVPLE